MPHRHLVFALPKVLRPAFRYRRSLVPKRALCAGNARAANIRCCTVADALPGAIVSSRTAKEFLNRQPHLHDLATAGAKLGTEARLSTESTRVKGQAVAQRSLAAMQAAGGSSGGIGNAGLSRNVG